MNQDDEKGWQIELNGDLGRGWLLLGNASRIETHNRETMFEEVYFHIEQENLGAFRIRGGFDYQESEGTMRQAFVSDATWNVSPAVTWNAQFEHQHVRAGVLGEYDQQWMKLELELPPRWSIDAILETNNKYDEQRVDEPEGPFPAGQITYTISRGGNLNLWYGKRQAGFLCSGGVCKYEPAFEGLEIFGVFRY